ncbi:MAG TPA: tRNA pseudouridine(38-40) synthase TruA [Flavisolibacter sp.]|jgi:tRNA pseudouridine38-40 synthase|nr:tRNA pseudouridine(38-40) synthase TruA [Flavisolibacter sp.]
MSRYFIEVAYRGTRYRGFQIQENAATIQSEVEQALKTLHRSPFHLTGSSRTDAGVHAFQNFFHFDFEGNIHSQAVYKLNAILPGDIVVKAIHRMHDDAHARFDAIQRKYIYKIHRFKNPFLENASLYYPYQLKVDLLEEGAAFLLKQNNFFAFSKTNTQVKNFNCTIYKSSWMEEGDNLFYFIEGNRFLRGMVRLITATLLKLGRGKITYQQFESLFDGRSKTVYSVPAHGLYLNAVGFPQNYFPV